MNTATDAMILHHNLGELRTKLHVNKQLASDNVDSWSDQQFEASHFEREILEEQITYLEECLHNIGG